MNRGRATLGGLALLAAFLGGLFRRQYFCGGFGFLAGPFGRLLRLLEGLARLLLLGLQHFEMLAGSVRQFLCRGGFRHQGMHVAVAVMVTVHFSRFHKLNFGLDPVPFHIIPPSRTIKSCSHVIHGITWVTWVV